MLRSLSWMGQTAATITPSSTKKRQRNQEKLPLWHLGTSEAPVSRELQEEMSRSETTEIRGDSKK